MVNIKVAVRIRPLSNRELLQGEEIVVRKENKSVVVINPKVLERQDGDSRKKNRRFSVDFCYDPQDPEGCSQEAVYKEIGSEVLDSILEGYNACVLAYGHSASGKTYTIMGLQDDPGLTPRLCEDLFQRAARNACDSRIRVEVTASFLEIYNEKVKDLLGSEETGAVSRRLGLRVREHPKLGPYVQGLSEHLVRDRRALVGLLSAGNRKRSTGTTEKNRESSRSHAVFTIRVRQSDGEKCDTEKWSKVQLVDLAGSERASSAQSKARLQEGAKINKSLVTLGYVISALAEGLEPSAAARERPACKRWQPFVPYRDSVLTWLLKESLGGNSKTIMIATISPASGCLSETVSTLRYAKRTRRIVNEAVVNEDPKVRTIRELRKEVARLRGLLAAFEPFQVTEGGCERREMWQRWVAEGGWRSDPTRGGGRVREGEGSGGRGTRGSVGRRSAASPRGAAVEVNDEKESVVNGSSNDSFSHESEIFSDSLESLGSGVVKGRSESSLGAERAGVGGGDKVKRMHRSRPDLIKGISGHVKERAPSTSSQSCAEVSNLSQSTSENSVTSSGSVEVQSSEGRGGREKNWRSEVVDAVTTRLTKKPEQWVRGVERKENGGEAEELKLCKRARMKLFDLRRKLGMTVRRKRTVDSDTQTESLRGTIRVKEKCVETESGGSLGEEAVGGDGRREVGQSGGTFVPGTKNCAVESGTQTVRAEKSDKSANTSPSEVSPRDEEWFSDDSLELEQGRGGGGRCLSGGGGGGGKEGTGECGLEGRRVVNGAVDSWGGRLGSRREEELSSEDCFMSGEGAEVVSSRGGSCEELGVGATGGRERELYTIAENSEQSEGSDAFSPVQSESLLAEAGVEGDGAGGKWRQSRGREEESGSAWKGGESTGKAKKMKWSDWQSSCERHYLNLKVSGNSRAPFSIESHLFGKEQSTDAVFASADSVTLVLMGPAKPKSSVLMEVIRRSLGRNCLADEAQSTRRERKSRGVQCEENLVRSVSVDMAMIALSRIARNQEQSPDIARSTSLGTLDPDGMDATPGEEKEGTTCQCHVGLGHLKADRKKSALKRSPGAEAAGNEVRRQEKQQEAERQKKSVSWSGATGCDAEVGSRPGEKRGDECEAPLHQRQPSGTVESTDAGSKSRFLKAEWSQATLASGAPGPRDELTAFLKEALLLLRKINSVSETGREVDADAQGDAGEKRSEKEGSEGRVSGGGASGGERRLNLTWPRRRGATGKPPTGVKGRFGRAGMGGGSESLQCSGVAEWGRNCRKGSGAVEARSWWAEEIERRGNEDAWDREGTVGGITPGRMRAGKVNLELVVGAERGLEECCRRLELAAERDELRERALLSKKRGGVGVEWGGFGAGVCGEGWEMEDGWVSWRKEVRKGKWMKRRKGGACSGECSCRASARDPCKHLLRKGCQSSFELDSFGPGSKHCHQMCMFCRKKEAELYSSALNLNSECLSDVCRLDYYGYCPCSSVRLSHVAWSPRAYMQHLLTLRRQMVGRTTARQLDSHSLRAHSSPCSSSI